MALGPGAIRNYVSGASVVDLLTRRLDRLSPATRHLLEVVACLGDRVGMSVLEIATGLTATALDPALAPALLDGLLTIDPGDDALVGFRHDRVQQAVFEQLARARRYSLHLDLARRFAVAPDCEMLSAAQYLPAAPLLVDADECRRVAVLSAPWPASSATATSPPPNVFWAQRSACWNAWMTRRMTCKSPDCASSATRPCMPWAAWTKRMRSTPPSAPARAMPCG
jgi:hypothetical protein